MIVNVIFATGRNGEMGMSDGSLPWKNRPELKEEAWQDMANFKRITSGNIVIMGYNTYLTFSNPLPNRVNIVIDKTCADENFSENYATWIFYPSIEKALAEIEKSGTQKKVYVIGGAKLLSECFENGIVNGEVHRTIFDADFPEASVIFKN